MSTKKNGFCALYFNSSNSGSVQVALTIIILIMIVAIAGGIFFYFKEESRIDSLTAKVQTLEKDIETLIQETKDKKRLFNLTVPNIQKIDNIFLAAKLSAEPYSTGLKVTGLIINSTALGQENVKFKITIGEQSKEIPAINSIPPGSSKKFEVYVPDVSIDKATSAQIQYVESSISYYKD